MSWWAKTPVRSSKKPANSESKRWRKRSSLSFASPQSEPVWCISCSEPSEESITEHSMTWYFVNAGQQAGPISDIQLDEYIMAGKILPDTLIWHEGMENWQPCQE